MKNLLILFFSALVSSSFAQTKETFDLAAYTVPKGWSARQKSKDMVSYLITDNQTGAYCQVVLYASTNSKGTLTSDFESEWQELVVKVYSPTKQPELTPKTIDEGWEVQAGVSPFVFNGGQSLAMLVTSSGYQRCMSLVMVTNTQAYQNDVESFIASIVLNKPTGVSTNKNDKAPSSVVVSSPAKPAIKTSFAYNITNFDDGWTSTVHEDWIQVEKGVLKVLIHHPYKQTKDGLDAIDRLKVAWDILVAPKYSAGSNFDFKVARGWENGEFGEADLVEKGTGKSVHVVLYKKNHSSGTGRYLEIIAPNRTILETEFGVFDKDALNWDKVENMITYNKFAVSAGDLTGKWSNNFSGFVQYVNSYTGSDAGMNTHASNENFEFSSGNIYKWSLSAASGMVGNLKFQNVKSNGKFSVPNSWQVNFSDIEGKPRSFDAHFTCVKGARILWLGDTGYGKIE